MRELTKDEMQAVGGGGFLNVVFETVAVSIFEGTVGFFVAGPAGVVDGAVHGFAFGLAAEGARDRGYLPE